MFTRITLSAALLLTAISFQAPAPASAEEAAQPAAKTVKAKKANKATKKMVATKVEASEAGEAKAGADAFVPYSTDSTFIGY